LASIASGALAELDLAIRAAARGQTYLSPDVSRAVVNKYLHRASGGSAVESSTPRQREILQMIAEGKPVKQIALILNVSVKTVESHRAQLLKRLDARDIATLVRYALRLGLISI